MRSKKRVDNRHGTLRQYANYLESVVLSQRQEIHQLKARLSTPNTALPSSFSNYSRPLELSTNVQSPAPPQSQSTEVVVLRPRETPAGYSVLKFPGPQKPQIRWETCVYKIAESIPTDSKKWQDAREKHGLESVSQNNLAIRLLISHPDLASLWPPDSSWSPDWTDCQKTINSPKPGVERAKAYCKQNLGFDRDAKLLRTLFPFRQLIVTVWFAVLEALGECTAREADEAMEEYFGSSSSKSMAIRRAAAISICKVTSELLESNWGTRCFEALLLST